MITAVGPDTGFSVGQEVVAYRVTGGWATAPDGPGRRRVREARATVTRGGRQPPAGRRHGLGDAARHGRGRGRDDRRPRRVGSRRRQRPAAGRAPRRPGRRDRRASATSTWCGRYGGIPVAYGDGLEQRVRDAAPDGVAAALDCIGTDEAVDVSLALVPDRDRIVTIAAGHRAEPDGIRHIAGAKPASKAYRDRIRSHLVGLAAEGEARGPGGAHLPARGCARGGGAWSSASTPAASSPSSPDLPLATTSSHAGVLASRGAVVASSWNVALVASAPVGDESAGLQVRESALLAGRGCRAALGR